MRCGGGRGEGGDGRLRLVELPRQHLVDQEDLGFEVGGHGEGQAPADGADAASVGRDDHPAAGGPRRGPGTRR